MAVTSSADGGYMDLMTCEQAAHVILEAGATGQLHTQPCVVSSKQTDALLSNSTHCGGPDDLVLDG